MNKVSISICTARYGGLEWQLKLLSRQTFKDFEVIVSDGCYLDRENEIKVLATDLGLNLTYTHEVFPFPSKHARSINENITISLATSPVLIFMDDYQVFPENYIEEHYKTCSRGFASICRWKKVKYIGDVDYSEVDLEITEEDPRYIEIQKRESQIHIREAPWDWWWPSSSAVPMSFLRKANGYNEMYCGGTGGEDVDLSYRMWKLGLQYIYNPDVVIYHIEHGNYDNPLIPMRKTPHRGGLPKCSYIHNVLPFTKNEYHQAGDRNLVENEWLYTWFDHGYKLFQCKHCGEKGAIDGIQMLENTKKRCNEGIYVPPNSISFPDVTHNCKGVMG